MLTLYYRSSTGNLLSWLSTLEPETDLERICAKRHGDTGTWFLESAHVKNWLEADSHQLLWCYGSRMFHTPDILEFIFTHNEYY